MFRKFKKIVKDEGGCKPFWNFESLRDCWLQVGVNWIEEVLEELSNEDIVSL